MVSEESFNRLQNVKEEIDPYDIFQSTLTIGTEEKPKHITTSSTTIITWYSFIRSYLILAVLFQVCKF